MALKIGKVYDRRTHIPARSTWPMARGTSYTHIKRNRLEMQHKAYRYKFHKQAFQELSKLQSF
eukprot:scaffold137042_cov27-Prasinocladus_malaysianus.AAC.2